MSEQNIPLYQATYFDGLTSQPKKVSVGLRADAFVIRLDASEPLIIWAFKDVYNQDEYIKGRALVLAHRSTPGAQLVVSDTETIQAFLDCLPKSQRSMTKISLSVPVILALTVLAIGAVLASGWVVRNSSGFIASLIPYSWERPIGEALVPQITEAREYAEKYPCRAEVQQKFLRRIIKRIDLKNQVPKDLEVLIDPTMEINAYALPGNTILINQGLIDYVANEHEILGVVAHEMGHLNHHHVMEGLVHSVGLRVLISAMTGGADASSIGSAGAQIFELGYSRDHEREADQSAVEYLKTAGLPTNQLADFLSRIEGQEGLMKDLSEHEMIGYFISHPLLKERMGILKKGLVAKGSKPAPLLSAAELKALKGARSLTCSKGAK